MSLENQVTSNVLQQGSVASSQPDSIDPAQPLCSSTQNTEYFPPSNSKKSFWKMALPVVVFCVMVLSFLAWGLIDFLSNSTNENELSTLPPASFMPLATLSPTSTPVATVIPLASLTPQPSPASQFTPHQMNVFVLSYFPLTSDGQTIDIGVTGDWDAPYSTTLQKTRDQTNNLVAALERGTKYLGYKNTRAQNSLSYKIIDVKEYTKAVPMLSDGSRRPDYKKILSDHDICTLVNKQGIDEVWMWAYQGPNYPGATVPYLNISESKMSGPFGDISNSYQENDMPQCGKTYRLYVFNYQRGTAEALHSWSHQLEREMQAVDAQLFASVWQGGGPAQTQNRMGRCGDVHHPPNSRRDYDYSNTTPQESDCLDWNPAGTGAKTMISCKNWGCTDFSDTNNAHINYLVWNMQNVPGNNNGKSFNGVALRNWWDVHGDFDAVMGSSKRLTVQ